MEASVYTVENRKGGVAKTTTAVTLAYRFLTASASRMAAAVCCSSISIPRAISARALGLQPGRPLPELCPHR